MVLAKSTGSAPCLLGKTWGYDDTGVWVSDGCSAEFVVAGNVSQPPVETPHELSDGFHSDGVKLQFSFKYNFSAKLGGS